jgi:hypothetical protein
MDTSNGSDKEPDGTPVGEGGECNEEEEEEEDDEEGSVQGPSTDAGRASKRAKVLVVGMRKTAK